MKYCEYCGKTLHDDAAFCSGCGKSCQSVTAALTRCQNCGYQLAADDQFCPACGTPIINAAPPQAPYPQDDFYPPASPLHATPIANMSTEPPFCPEKKASPSAPTKKHKLPKWVLAVIALTLVAAISLGVFALCGGFIHRADFPIQSISNSSIQEFMDVVSKNTNGNYNVYVSAQDTYVAGPHVSLNDAIRSKDSVRVALVDFLNGRINLGYVALRISAVGNMEGATAEQVTENQYATAKDFIIALEKTMTGKSEAGTYFKSYSEMKKKAATLAADGIPGECKLGSYWLNEKTKVHIVLSCLKNTWTVTYQVSIYP